MLQKLHTYGIAYPALSYYLFKQKKIMELTTWKTVMTRFEIQFDLIFKIKN